ncbi:D-3-phosphoglycerate dehydrogenase [Microtetraspora sp. NBRC 13810]|nr:D-3-phosphoglycerate dehydrogenase [Microtetraspora sp. NBRC 13810]
MRPRALVLARLPADAVQRLAAVAEVVSADEFPELAGRPAWGFSDERLADLVIGTGARVLVTDGDEVRGAVLGLPLDIVACVRAPTRVDVRLARERGVAVLHSADHDVDAVAELTVALLFAVNRHIVTADRDVRGGRVYRRGLPPAQRHRGVRLAGRTFGIVGLGRVGTAVRWRMRGLGMHVIACDPHVPEAGHTLPALLAEADVVSVHAELTAETRGLIGSAEFAAMRPGAIYLNTARGGLHDVAALVDTLRGGHLGGAGLDHFEGEWLDPDHPLVRLSNVVLTPCLGEATGDSEAERAGLVVDDVVRVIRSREV